MITVLHLIEALILPGHQNRFKSLHDKLGTSDMGLVFTLVCIYKGINTNDQISDLHKQKCPKKNLRQCEANGWITSTLEVSPHDKRARFKVYSLTEAGTEQAQLWSGIFETLLTSKIEKQTKP